MDRLMLMAMGGYGDMGMMGGSTAGTGLIDSIKTKLSFLPEWAVILVIAVLVISAGMLAFIVLYNLNNINISERKRELATLKVLGFFDGEVSAYVNRENIMLTVIGTAVGLLMGVALHRYVMTTVETDTLMFGRVIQAHSYVFSILLTFAFSIIVNGMQYFKLRKIDMVESLKSVE